MTTYYRVSDAQLRDLTQPQYNALAPNKQADLRLYVIDAQPVPSASQVVVQGPVVVGVVDAHLTYTLREKTAAELNADDLEAEKAQLDAWLTDIQTLADIDNATWNAMSNTQKFDTLRDFMRVGLKALKRFIKQEKRAL